MIQIDKNIVIPKCLIQFIDVYIGAPVAIPIVLSGLFFIFN